MEVEVLRFVLMAVVGLAGGVAVGGGLVSFLVLIDVLPRLAQLTGSYRKTRWFELSMVSGTLFWTCADFFNWKLYFPVFTTALIGIFSGCFIGMLAAGLTEVLNVLPIMARRIGIRRYIRWLLLAMIVGKVAGSLFQWFFL